MWFLPGFLKIPPRSFEIPPEFLKILPRCFEIPPDFTKVPPWFFEIPPRCFEIPPEFLTGNTKQHRLSTGGGGLCWCCPHDVNNLGGYLLFASLFFFTKRERDRFYREGGMGKIAECEAMTADQLGQLILNNHVKVKEFESLLAEHCCELSYFTYPPIKRGSTQKAPQNIVSVHKNGTEAKELISGLYDYEAKA